MIRLASPEDAPGLADVHITSWQHAYRGIFPEAFLGGLDRQRRTEFFTDRLQAGSDVFVAEVDSLVVAFCWPDASSEEGWGEILAIYAHPRHWGGGHGRAVLEAGEEHLKAQGFDRALLWVIDANARARGFYERMGWARASALKIEDIGGVQVTEVRYEKTL